MEPAILFADKLPPDLGCAGNPLEHRQAPETHSLLTEAVLAELKRQASAGCLLCSIEDLDEDWD